MDIPSLVSTVPAFHAATAPFPSCHTGRRLGFVALARFGARAVRQTWRDSQVFGFFVGSGVNQTGQVLCSGVLSDMRDLIEI